MTVELKAFGMSFELEEAAIETGFTLIEKLRIQGVSATDCMAQLAKELNVKSAVAVAVYAAYHAKNKPLF